MWATSFDIPNGARQVLNEQMINEISSYLPIVLALRRWQLSYCTKLHGISFGSFYRLVSEKGPSILVVRDSDGVIFGAFISESIRNSTSYYGTGEMFVFTYRMERSDCEVSDILSPIYKNTDYTNIKHSTCICRMVYCDDLSDQSNTNSLKSGDKSFLNKLSEKNLADNCSKSEKVPNNVNEESNISQIKVFPWSGKNCFYIYSDSNHIAVGGGGSYALAIDADFLRGWSSPCVTFDSPCLSRNEDFIISAFQVWTLADDSM
ncbi:TLD domain-containing protein [Cryptosporidium muris RN66]|uniref:Oxidation resistance protein 1 n=1 Tax=Cryptosporidium muris (strain RN66) TaxID=441375 RepID=B6A9Y1_CRYMR|nr:TLD domain-containing protein [Cryptosporidium muris RN66]EEA05022.1 TLD domain-containing protein [Cryptosporidium muris RN66]|eukprot:XP_002139371.1 TLD domain-containing protein [Cryptosporidium muris RN66]